MKPIMFNVKDPAEPLTIKVNTGATAHTIRKIHWTVGG
jgi:hypothetical protein